MDIVFSYKGAPTLKAFSSDDKFIRGLMGPFGSGKSSACVIEIMRRAAVQEPGPDGVRRSRWAIVRNTYPELRDTTIRTVHDWLPPGEFGQYRKSDHSYVIDKLENIECELLFMALDRPDHVKHLLSLELTGAWVNEAREVPWSLIEALQGRVGRYPSMRDGGPSWFGIIMDTNPPDDMSGWYKFFEESEPANAAIFKQPSGLSDKAENVHNLPKGYYENLATGKSEEFKKVYVDGNYGFVVEGKPVYPEYSDSMHCRPCSPMLGRTIRRGWDFGLTPAVTFSQLLPTGQWIVFDELCAQRAGIDRFSDEALLHCNERYRGYEWEDFGDPAGADPAQTDERTCFEIMQGKGISIEAGERTLIRIESVRKPLSTLIDGEPGILIDPKCKILRRGFLGGYNYKRMQVSAERYQEKPDKNLYSHPHDALQYDASMLFGDALRGASHEWAPIEYDNRWVV